MEDDGDGGMYVAYYKGMHGTSWHITRRSDMHLDGLWKAS